MMGKAYLRAFRKYSFTSLLTALFCGLIHCVIAQNQSTEAEKLYSIGQQLYEEGKYNLAGDTLSIAATIFQQGKDTLGYIRSVNLAAECLANLSRCDEAIKMLNHSLSLATASLPKDHPEIGQTYYYLSRATGGCSRKFDDAFALMRKSTAIKKKLYGNLSAEIAFDYNFIGYMFNETGRYDSAHVYLNKALDIRQKKLPSDDVEISNTLYNLAKCYEYRSELRKSLDLHQQALRIRNVTLGEWHASVSNSINAIGRVYKKLGNNERALVYQQQALEIRKKTLGAEHPNVAGSYYDIGNLYGTISNYHEAIQYLQQGNRVLEKNRQAQDDILATYYAYTGKMYGLIGEHEAAVEHMKKGETLAGKILSADHPYRAVVYNIAGEYFGDVGDLAKQSEYFRKAIAIYRKAFGSGSEREGDVLAKMGTTNAALKNHEQAMTFFNLALDIYRHKLGDQNPKVASVYHALGDIFREGNKYNEALAAYNKAFISISSRFRDTTDLYGNPRIEELESKPLALRIARSKASLIFRQAKSAGNDVARLKDALTAFQFAIDLVDDISGDYSNENARIDLDKERRKIYTSFMDVAWLLHSHTKDRHYLEDAFRVSEKSKSAILLETTKDRMAKTQGGVPDSLAGEERDIKIELAYYKNGLFQARKTSDTTKIPVYEQSIFEAERRYERFKKMLERQFPSYYNLKYKKGDATVASVQKSLRETSSLLAEFFVGDTSLYRFIVSRESCEFSFLKKGESLQRLIKDYQRSLTDASLIIDFKKEADSLYSQSASALYKLLLDPLPSPGGPPQKLIIAADDVLAQLNFGTLLCEKPNGENIDYKALEYVARRYQVSYAYSSAFLSQALQKRKNPEGTFAGFAPSYPENQFAGLDSTGHPLTYLVVRSGNLPLPGAVEEVKLISGLMGGKYWLNSEATESNFKEHAGNYGILHLAMHSLLNNETPHYSELLFNHEDDAFNDGYLTISEIYNLNLNAQLVVLSACSSGYGKIQGGEGPISISRAFSYAGCPSVVMTLWKIPDVVTGEIMASFYEALKDGQSKDEALRTAQLKFLNETNDPLYRHPYFWAGFVVMGDTGTIKTSGSYWKVISVLSLVILSITFVILRRRRLSHSNASSN